MSDSTVSNDAAPRSKSNQRPRTRLPVQQTVPLVPPIVHTATFTVNSVEHFQDIMKTGKGFAYIRFGTPNCVDVEQAVNELEGGAGSVVFGSGMAAITTTLMSFLRPGDHVVAGYPAYGCTHKFLMGYLKPSFDIDVTFVEGSSIAEYRNAIRPNTKLLYGETPSNPLLSVLDMEGFGNLGAESGHKIITVVDATFASPLLLKPIHHGVDVVIHSATKYLGGHEDLCAGVVTARTDEHFQLIQANRLLFGGILSPHDACLLLRGMKTLEVRMERECDTAHQVALFLETHPAVSKVHYPGLASHPQHNVASRQMYKYGAMVAFEVEGGAEPAIRVVNNLRTFKLAVSLGGVTSLAEHPASMTHGPFCMSDEDREAAHIGPGLIRLSIGLESVGELVCDLQQALDLL